MTQQFHGEVWKKNESTCPQKIASFPSVLLFLLLFHRLGNWGSERLNNLFKAAQLVMVRSEIKPIWPGPQCKLQTMMSRASWN